MSTYPGNEGWRIQYPPNHVWRARWMLHHWEEAQSLDLTMYPLAKDLPTEASAIFKSMGAELREGVPQVLSPSLSCAFATSHIETSSHSRGGQLVIFGVWQQSIPTVCRKADREAQDHSAINALRWLCVGRSTRGSKSFPRDLCKPAHAIQSHDGQGTLRHRWDTGHVCPRWPIAAVLRPLAASHEYTYRPKSLHPFCPATASIGAPETPGAAHE